jgi:hypothetical protein
MDTDSKSMDTLFGEEAAKLSQNVLGQNQQLSEGGW